MPHHQSTAAVELYVRRVPVALCERSTGHRAAYLNDCYCTSETHTRIVKQCADRMFVFCHRQNTLRFASAAVLVVTRLRLPRNDRL